MLKADRLVANLPAIDFVETKHFYALLGFKCVYDSANWMILKNGNLQVEFFLHPELDPTQSWHSACIRVHDLDGLYQHYKILAWNDFPNARMTAIEQNTEIRLFNIIDPNGSLLRCIQID